MDRLQRIYKLHQVIISHRRPVPHQRLQEKLGCSRASVSRIIRELRLCFNAPLEYDRECNGYYYNLKEGENFESLRVQFPAPWGESWLKASGLKSAVNTPLLAAGCFICRASGSARTNSKHC